MKRITAFMVALFIGISSMPVYASETTDDTTVYMIVNYSDSVTPQESDDFVITYRDAESEDEATIEFNGAVLNGKAGGMNIAFGSYEITDIKYAGQNQQILNEGYAVSAKFKADSLEPGTFYVGIGASEIQNMKLTGADLLVYENDVLDTYVSQPETETSKIMESTTHEQEPTKSEATESNMSDPTSNDASSTVAFYEDDYTPLDGSEKGNTTAVDTMQGEKKDIDTTKSFEKHETDGYNPSGKELLFRGIPAMILGLIGAIIIFIIHKKGIL